MRDTFCQTIKSGNVQCCFSDLNTIPTLLFHTTARDFSAATPPTLSVNNLPNRSIKQGIFRLRPCWTNVNYSFGFHLISFQQSSSSSIYRFDATFDIMLVNSISYFVQFYFSLTMCQLYLMYFSRLKIHSNFLTDSISKPVSRLTNLTRLSHNEDYTTLHTVLKINMEH